VPDETGRTLPKRMSCWRHGEKVNVKLLLIKLSSLVPERVLCRANILCKGKLFKENKERAWNTGFQRRWII